MTTPSPRPEAPRDLPVILSLGAGVQSSTLALMAAAGEVGPMPVAAIFADTQAEPRSVYAWLDWLEERLPFPVRRVTAGSLEDTIVTLRTRAEGGTYIQQSVPAWVESDGRAAPLMRGCTRDYKVRPIIREAKRLIRELDAPGAIQWIGISKDEAHRMKDSGERLIRNAWPLVERRMTRTHCIEWMTAHGYPTPPRSACVFCPYHSDAEWYRLKTEEPDAFARAVDVEQRMHLALTAATAATARTTPYFHPSLRPLPLVDFEPDRRQLNLFGNECEGLCGV